MTWYYMVMFFLTGILIGQSMERYWLGLEMSIKADEKHRTAIYLKGVPYYLIPEDEFVHKFLLGSMDDTDSL